MSWEEIVKEKNALKAVLGNKEKAIELLTEMQGAVHDSLKYIPWGSAGGKKTPTPEEDKYKASYNELVSKISGELGDVIMRLHNLSIESGIEILIKNADQ